MNQRKTLLTRLQSSWWFAWIVAAVLALSQLKSATEGIDSLLIFFKIKPDALALAQTAEKGEFSRGLTEAAWRRLFWARCFQARIEKGAAVAEIDEAWKAYIAASELWATRLMVFIISTEKFYGQRKADELEIDVQSALTNMGNTLITLRYSKTPDANILKAADEKIDAANIFLYKFVRGFDQQKGYSSIP